MERRELTGSQLAEDIGLSAASVSRIVTGQSRPRQVTLSRLMKRLCTSKEEEQMLIAAYESKDAEGLPLAPLVSEAANAQAEEERVERFLEVKTQSILFKRSVARQLELAKHIYSADFCRGSASTDFLVNIGSRKIALECKSNVHRDISKTVTTAKILRAKLGCSEVICVVPFGREEIEEESAEIRFVNLSELNEALQSITYAKDEGSGR